MQTLTLTDDQIIDDLRAGGSARERAWRFIFQHWRGLALASISKMGGSPDEALEAFRQVAMPFQNRVCQADFALETASLSTYFVRCARFAFLKTRQKNGLAFADLAEADRLESDGAGIERDLFSSELRALLDRSLAASVGPRCQKILALFNQNFTMRELAVEMGWGPDDELAKKEKYKCQQKFLAFLAQNPSIREQLKELWHAS